MTITGNTGVFCVIGYPIRHSLSPVIHNTGFREHGLDLVFVPFPLHPDKVGEGMKGLRALGIKGMTVTVPLKELILPCLDKVDETARLTGAVNTVTFEDGVAAGFNLDVAGVTYSLKKLEFPEGSSRAVVLGTGGAARAVIAALMLFGTGEIVILSRTEGKARDLKEFFARESRGQSIGAGDLGRAALKRYLPDCDLLVNTTPVGMYPNTGESPIPVDEIPRGIRVLDAVYRPEKTLFLASAEKKDCRTLSGLDWLVRQAILAFRIWTGKDLQQRKIVEVLRTFTA